MSIYVEILVRGSLDELWQRTQDPKQHQRWDLRFTSIDYLPKADESEPQRFSYSTRIGLGLTVRGQGESRADRDAPGGQRASSLRFWSGDRKSLIREGAGYWRYLPAGDGTRFVTAYDYRVRFGAAGRLFDRLVFRPLLGWATAWSFDRLRLWIERGIDPADSMRRSLIHALARFGVAGVWIYQGFVPKLLAAHPDELALLTAAGVPGGAAPTVLAALGWCELLLGVATLARFRSPWPLWVAVVLMFVATFVVAATAGQFLVAAFNPVSMNLAVALLASIGLVALGDLPSATNCLRDRPENA